MPQYEEGDEEGLDLMEQHAHDHYNTYIHTYIHSMKALASYLRMCMYMFSHS